MSLCSCGSPRQGKYLRCGSCLYKYRKEMGIKPDKEYMAEYRKSHRKISLDYGRRYRQTAINSYKTYKYNANTRGLVFPITLEEFSRLRDKPCFYCGDSGVPNGLDRVDNSLGYLIENVVPCCSQCNVMKLDYDLESFLEKCRKIAERFPCQR